MNNQNVNPLAIKQGIKANATKSKGVYGTSYGGYGGSPQFGNAMLDAVGAFEGTAATAMGMYGGNGAAAPTVLAAAFSGVNSYNAHAAGTPSFASGGMNSMTAPGLLPGSGSAVVPGTEGFNQMDMINTMNQNNLQLLELQAVMQTNMQGWNTKSNILSADHRARMAMIEKFTARG
jgi:hypothetical protein